MARRPLTREESKGRTRQRLLDAGWRVFVRDGYYEATLARIAREAGYTTGAVYSAFDSKADLFLAVLDRWLDERLAQIERWLEYPDDEVAAQAAAEWIERLRSEPGWQIVLLEFWLHAARDRKLIAAFRARNERLLVTATRMVQLMRERAGLQPSLLARELVVASTALGYGFVLERLADPEHVSEQHYGRAQIHLAAGFGAAEPAQAG